MKRYDDLGKALKDIIEKNDAINCGAEVVYNKNSFLSVALQPAIEKGIHSGNIVREVAKIANGKGGGRPNMAQAGATDVSKVDEALSYASEVIKSQVK